MIRVVGHTELGRTLARALAGERQRCAEVKLCVLAGWESIAALRLWAESAREPWLLVEDAGPDAVAIGPLFHERTHGCLECYLGRRRSNGARGCRPPVGAADFAIPWLLDAVSAATDQRSDLESAQRVVTRTGVSSYHPFLGLPVCSRCWERTRRPAAHRGRSLVDRRVGLVHRLDEMRPAGAELPLCHASGSRTDAFSDRRALNIGFAAAPDAEAARCRAVAESIERYCPAFPPNDLPLAQADELPGRSLRPRRLMRRHAEAADRAPLRWVAATRLVDDDEVWVPAAAVYLPYRRAPGEPRLDVQSSNGLAAGESIVGAIHSGLLEVIERDAFMRTWRSGVDVEPVDLRPLEIPGLHLARLCSDVPVEVVVAFIERDEPPYTAMGCAARLTLEAAAEAASLEALANRVGLLSWLATGPAPVSLPVRTLADHARAHATRPELRQTRKRFTQAARPARRRRRSALTIDDIVATAAPDACWVRLTTPDVEHLGLEVVRVLVPERVPFEDDDLQPRLQGSVMDPHPGG